jgi:hypothetical protein
MENETNNSSATREEAEVPDFQAWSETNPNFPATLPSQAHIPSPVECVHFYTKKDGRNIHEFCGNLDLSTQKSVKGGSWSKGRLPCCPCPKFEKKPSAP